MSFQEFRLRPKHLLACVLLVLATRAVWSIACGLAAGRTGSLDRMYENGDIAANLLAGRGFALSEHAFLPPGPTAHKPPVYPALIAAARYAAGDSAPRLIRAAQAVFVSIAITLTAVVAAESFGLPAGAAAALLMAASPSLGKIHVTFENTALAFLFSSLFLYFYSRAFRGTGRHAAGAGFFLGLTVLTNPAFAAFAPIAAAAPLAARRARQAALIAAAALAVLLPWTVRNHAVFGRWFCVTSNFPFELWIGNNPAATGSLAAADGAAMPLPRDLVSQTTGLNEVDAYRVFGTEARRYIAENPARFAALRAKSFFYFLATARPWLVRPSAVDFVNVAWALFMVGTATGGCLLALRARTPGLALWLLFFASFSALYALTHADIIDRYRLPLDPYLLVFSGYFISRAAAREPSA